MRERLARAEQGEGETLFDIVLQIIFVHTLGGAEAEDRVHFVLEDGTTGRTPFFERDDGGRGTPTSTVTVEIDLLGLAQVNASIASSTRSVTSAPAATS